MSKKPKHLVRDNIHLNLRPVQACNKIFNFILSPREPGKSTCAYTLVYKMWRHRHLPSVILVRQSVDITEEYIDSILDTINKFLAPQRRIKFYYKQGGLEKGIVDIFIDKNKTNKILRVQSLSIPKQRAKKMAINAYCLILDEYVIDTSKGEKYLKEEVDRYKNVYETYQRYAVERGHQLKCYFFGNPYSIYTPYHIWKHIPLDKIKPGCFLVGADYVLWAYQLKEELKQAILERNPLFKFDDVYTRYAFGGISVNDERFVIVPKMPKGFKLKYIFKLNERYMYVWRNTSTLNAISSKWYINTQDKLIPTAKSVYSVDFNNLVEGTYLVTSDIKFLFICLKEAVARRNIAYDSVESAYAIESIYSMI